jgi:predicted esterase YcpF (UPF0227 family)
MPTTHLLYLHGFRSSPMSTKARLVQQRIAQRHPRVTLWCPQLPPSPRQAMDEVTRGIASWPRAQMAVMGSSLGGYYATWIAEQTGCRAALLNPAVHAARDLATQVGVHPSWHEPRETFEFKASYVDELRELAVPVITRPERYYALIAQGDEVLDWREMSAHYPGTQGRVLAGSDHAITEFALYLDEVLGFLDLAS